MVYLRALQLTQNTRIVRIELLERLYMPMMTLQDRCHDIRNIVKKLRGEASVRPILHRGEDLVDTGLNASGACHGLVANEGSSMNASTVSSWIVEICCILLLPLLCDIS